MPIATPPASASGSDAMPADERRGEDAQQQPGPTPSADAPAGLSGAKSIAAIAASAPGDHPDDRRHLLDVDAGEARGVRVGGRRRGSRARTSCG